MLAHLLEMRQDERVRGSRSARECTGLFLAGAISGGCDEPFEPARIGLLDDLKVEQKEAEKELNVIVEGTHEGLERGRARRLLERLKGVACGF